MLGQLIWKSIKFTDGKYHVSNTGKVRSIYTISKLGKRSLTGTVLKTTINHRGYEKVRLQWRENGKLFNKTLAVHRLVCMAFYDNPEGKPQVNHKDCNPLNNNFENLEWCTAKENTNHAQMMGRIPIRKPYVKKGYAHRFKKVINIKTNEIFDSIEVIVAKEKCSKTYLRKQLLGDRINTTDYRYIGKEDFIRKPYAEKEKSPIIVFNSEWVEVRRFDRKNEAAKFIGEKSASGINDFLKGKCSHVKGYKFKEIATDGNLIEPISFVPFIRPPKKIKPKGYVSPSKEVIQFDLSGCEVRRFSSLGETCRVLVAAKGQIRKAMQRVGGRPGYYKGFIYRFA